MKALIAGICLIPAAYGQKFEVASVRVAAPRNMYVGARKGGPGTADPERFTWEYAPFLSILIEAFGVQPSQIEGSGLEDQRYDITAKVPEGTTKDGLDVMLQNLLIDRFGLKFHHQSRVMAVYELTVAKSGSKLKESDGSSTETSGRYINGVIKLTLGRSTVRDLAGQLGTEVERVIVDKTGLKGVYDFRLEYSREGLRPLGPAPAVQDPAPSLFTAVQEQLGLKLEPAKEPVDVMMVDSINKIPADN